MSEFDLIAALRDRLGAIGCERIELGIGDDAALWRPDPGQVVVACCDSLIAGRHFPEDTDPFDLGWKALAVNLSDLAAMGAEPVAALLALSLPALPTVAWIPGFCAGWAELAQQHNVVLAGGDTTRGPVLSLTVTCLGQAPIGAALRRDGARRGDDLYVSGSLGDAAAGLKLWPQRVLSDQAAAASTLIARLCRPSPQVALGMALRGLASSAIDVSDGLLADVRHVLTASDVGADIELARLPLSDALRASVSAAQAQTFALTGGDDYELCFTADPARAADLRAVAQATGTPITRIGTIIAGNDLLLRSGSGYDVVADSGGWDHFRD